MNSSLEMWQTTVELLKHHDDLFWSQVRHYVGILVLLGGGAGAVLITTGFTSPLKVPVISLLLLLGAFIAIVGLQVTRAEGEYIGFATSIMSYAESITVNKSSLPPHIRSYWIARRGLQLLQEPPPTQAHFDLVVPPKDAPKSESGGTIRSTISYLFLITHEAQPVSQGWSQTGIA